jgi:hypothetical protein
MSAAFCPQIEGGTRANASAVDGKALARSSELLNALATRYGVNPLTSFISVHTDDYGMFEDAGLPVPEPKWFLASDGRKTVRMLRDACRAEGMSDDALCADLDTLDQVLAQCERENRRWSLGVDI